MTTAPGHRFTGTLSRPNRFNWRRAVAYGPLLGVTIAVMETSVLPLDAMSAGRWLGFELSLMVIWSVAGVVLTSATMLLESRLRPWMMVPFMITFSLLISAGWSGSFGLGFETVQLESSNWFDRYSRLHIFWSCAFYGGLFVFALRVGMQSERTRRLLGSAELARQQTESVLSEALAFLVPIKGGGIIRLQFHPAQIRPVPAPQIRDKPASPAAAQRRVPA